MKHAVRLDLELCLVSVSGRRLRLFLSRLKISKQPANLTLFQWRVFSLHLGKKDDILSLCGGQHLLNSCFMRSSTNLSSWLIHLYFVGLDTPNLTEYCSLNKTTVLSVRH